MLLEDMYVNVDMETIPKYAKIAGVSFYDRQRLIESISVGDVLKLKRDYKNEYDKYAIAVCSKAGNVGWIPKYISKVLASELDCGITWLAKVTCITGLDKDTKGVNIELIFIDK